MFAFKVTVIVTNELTPELITTQSGARTFSITTFSITTFTITTFSITTFGVTTFSITIKTVSINDNHLTTLSLAGCQGFKSVSCL
jgi:hypothetical protein